jgi:hypothetical protein
MNERLRQFFLRMLLPVTLAGAAGAATADGEAVVANGQAAGFSLEELQWQYRVLVVSAPGPDDAATRLQLEAIEASRAQFEERDLLLVTLFGDSGSVAGDRPLTADEAARVRSGLGVDGEAFALRLIGKDGGIKLARGTVVSMEEVYMLIDTMPMRRREMER